VVDLLAVTLMGFAGYLRFASFYTLFQRFSFGGRGAAGRFFSSGLNVGWLVLAGSTCF